MEKELHIVGFQIGRETYGVPITSVHEIVRVPEITPVPDSPHYIEGVINLRGKIISILDLRKRFRESNLQKTSKNRVLVAEVRGKLVGLVVDSASEVLKLSASEVDPTPALVHEGGLHCITGVAKLKGRLIILLDLDRLLESADTQAKTVEPQAAASSPKTEPSAAARGAKAGGGK